jgi:hypothetical protein
MMTHSKADAFAPGLASAEPIDFASIRQVVLAACRAPSIHNSQPWRWRVRGDVLELWADRSRHLHETDPRGRDLTISCGAALHHALVAASAIGFLAVVDRFPDPEQPDQLAQIRLFPATVPGDAAAVLEAIEERCTDRRRFTAWPIPAERIARLVAAAAHPNVVVTAVTDPVDRLRVDLLVRRAIGLQARNPAMLTEQIQWMVDSRSDEVNSASAITATDSLLTLSTPADDRLAWLYVGESLSALWLGATRDGLSVIPLSRVIETELTRRALQTDVLDSAHIPQLLLRVGWQRIGRAAPARTSRLSLSEILETRPALRNRQTAGAQRLKRAVSGTDRL